MLDALRWRFAPGRSERGGRSGRGRLAHRPAHDPAARGAHHGGRARGRHRRADPRRPRRLRGRRPAGRDRAVWPAASPPCWRRWPAPAVSNSSWCRTPATSCAPRSPACARTSRCWPATASCPTDQRDALMADLRSELGELTALVDELVLVASDQRDDEPAQPVRARRPGRPWWPSGRGAATAAAVRVGGPRRRGGGATRRAGAGGDEPARQRRQVRTARSGHRGAPGRRPGGGAGPRPGIDPADRPRMFDRFYRARSARPLPGSGLGLAIVRQVVVANGGTVFADNDPGGGAVVGFELPLVGPPAPEPAPGAPDGLTAAPRALTAERPRGQILRRARRSPRSAGACPRSPGGARQRRRWRSARVARRERERAPARDPDGGTLRGG